jgi:hypothetical protein
MSIQQEWINGKVSALNNAIKRKRGRILAKHWLDAPRSLMVMMITFNFLERLRKHKDSSTDFPAVREAINGMMSHRRMGLTHVVKHFSFETFMKEVLKKIVDSPRGLATLRKYHGIWEECCEAILDHRFGFDLLAFRLMLICLYDFCCPAKEGHSLDGILFTKNGRAWGNSLILSEKLGEKKWLDALDDVFKDRLHYEKNLNHLLSALQWPEKETVRRSISTRGAIPERFFEFMGMSRDEFKKIVEAGGKALRDRVLDLMRRDYGGERTEFLEDLMSYSFYHDVVVESITPLFTDKEPVEALQLHHYFETMLQQFKIRQSSSDVVSHQLYRIQDVLTLHWRDFPLDAFDTVFEVLHEERGKKKEDLKLVILGKEFAPIADDVLSSLREMPKRSSPPSADELLKHAVAGHGLIRGFSRSAESEVKVEATALITCLTEPPSDDEGGETELAEPA